MWPSEGIDLSRLSYYRKWFSFSCLCCMYFFGHHAVATCTVIHSMVGACIPLSEKLHIPYVLIIILTYLLYLLVLLLLYLIFIFIKITLIYLTYLISKAAFSQLNLLKFVSLFFFRPFNYRTCLSYGHFCLSYLHLWCYLFDFPLVTGATITTTTRWH